jgi:hypothetical protein
VWGAGSYTIRYNGNGHSGGTVPANQTKVIGSGLTLPAQGTLARSGHTFIGWNTASNGSGTAYTAGAALAGELSTTNRATVTLYAQWTENVINLTTPNSSTGYGWTYVSGVFTVANGADVKVTGSSAYNRVVAAANATATVTLHNVSIVMSSAMGSPLDLSDGANLTLILSGTNTLASKGSAAGINVPAGRTLTVSSASTGTLTVTGSASGSSGGAGIGGSGGSSGGTITVSGGTITATGAAGGAGIGGGSGGSGGTLTFTRNTVLVTATGGQNAAGIGGGQNGAAGTINIEWVQDSLGYAARGAPRAGSGASYDIGPGAGGSGGTLRINNTAVSQWPANQFIWPAGNTINLSCLIIVGPNGYTYSAENHKYTVTNGANVTVRGSTTTDNILVPSNATATITLENANIKMEGTTTRSPIELDNGANVTLILVGTFDYGGGNYLFAAGAGAGIKVNTGRTLTIQGDGSLEARGAPQDNETDTADFSRGAGIGGSGLNAAAGTINIRSGTIYAYGGKGKKIYNKLDESSWHGGAAGIGGSSGAAGGNINITGGWVAASGYDGAAGIGGGSGPNGAAGTININYPSGTSRGWALATYSFTFGAFQGAPVSEHDIGPGLYASGGTVNIGGTHGLDDIFYTWRP